MNISKIKLFYILFVCSLSLSTLHAKKNITSTHQSLVYEKSIATSKLITTPLIIGCVAYCYKDTFIQAFKESPFTSIIASCWTLNFLSDAFLKYQHINQTLLLFQKSKEIFYYMICALVIQNTIDQLATKNGTSCKIDCLQSVMEQIPLSFTELEQFALELLHTSDYAFQKLHIDIQTELEEKIYVLYKENLTLEELLTLYDDETTLYPYLKKFQKNPIEFYPIIIQKLNNLIKNNLKSFTIQ